MRDYKEISYTIDGKDQLVSVSSEWEPFAKKNQAPELTKDAVVGHSLWDFIVDDPTKELYRTVLEHVRKGHPKSLVLRCDGPKCRRLIEMTFSPLSMGSVEIKTVLLGIKSRPHQRLFSLNTPRNGRHVMVCSWCNQVYVHGDLWMEVESAMKKLRLEDKPVLPQMQFVVCPKCFSKVIELMAQAEKGSLTAVY